MINGPATECSSKARERLQVLLRIRPCPSTRRITAKSQSQRGQAPLRIGSHSSSDEWIRHDFLCFFCRLSACLGELASRERQMASTRGSSQVKGLHQFSAATDLLSPGAVAVPRPGWLLQPWDHSLALVSFSFSNRCLNARGIKIPVDRLDRCKLSV